MKREFIVTDWFAACWKHMGLTDQDMRRLENEILSNPKLAPVMAGTGGARKLRFAFEDRGKSGSVRVIYVDFNVYEKIFLIDAYAKTDKDNLSKAERNDLRGLIEILELELEKGRNSNERKQI